MLPLDIDPKLAWALKFRDSFPVDVNRAPKRDAAARAGARHQGGRAHSRRRGGWRKLRLDDVARLTLSIAKVRPFIATADWRPTLLTDRADLRTLIAPKQQQLELFAPDVLREGPMIDAHRVTLAAPDDFDGWRDAARDLAEAGVPASAVVWQVEGEPADLFGSDAEPAAAASFPVPRAFVDLAQTRRLPLATRSASLCSTRCCCG